MLQSERRSSPRRPRAPRWLRCRKGLFLHHRHVRTATAVGLRGIYQTQLVGATRASLPKMERTWQRGATLDGEMERGDAGVAYTYEGVRDDDVGNWIEYWRGAKGSCRR